MTVEAAVDHAEPKPQPPDQALRAQATGTVMRLLGLHPEAGQEAQETWRTRVHLRELTKRSEAAERTAAETAQVEANLMVKFDPAGRRSPGFGLGAAVIVALVILAAFPLSWAARAFGLDPDGTLLVTFILVVASVGAMLGFELAARRLADDTVDRHAAALHRMLFQWALDMAPPQGIDYAQWNGALDQAVHELFRAP
jgi:hypothetical protein